MAGAGLASLRRHGVGQGAAAVALVVAASSGAACGPQPLALPAAPAIDDVVSAY